MKLKLLSIVFGLSFLSITQTSFSQISCTVDFTYTVDPNFCDVFFTNQSTGSSSLTYTWTFSNGQMTSLANPIKNFSGIGPFFAKLVTSVNGTRCDSITKQIITPCETTPSCDAKFAYSIDTTGGQCTVNFQNQSTGSNLSYLWLFSDTTQSTNQHPSHMFSGYAPHRAKLYIYSNTSLCDSLEESLIIPCASIDTTCVAQFIYSLDTTQCQYTFTNQSLGHNLTYLWDFGDGAQSTQANQQYTYPGQGTYTVTLITINQNQPCDTVKQVVTAPCTECISQFTHQTSQTDCKTKEFINQSTGDNLSYIWYFGDGNQSTNQDPTHTYSTTGTYTVSLSTYSSNDLCDSLAVVVNVNCDTTCNAVFTHNITQINSTTYQVAFNNFSSGYLLSYVWDFGDGNTSTLTNPVNTYTAVGSYSASLFVKSQGIPCDTMTTIINCGITTGMINSLIDVGSRVYPNPTTDLITVSSKHEIQTVEIYNMMGKLVLQYTNVMSNELVISLKTIDAGSYYLKITSKEAEINTTPFFKLNN